VGQLLVVTRRVRAEVREGPAPALLDPLALPGPERPLAVAEAS
jgi:hypothetical protein